MAPGDDRIRRYYIFRAVTSFALWMPFWTLWIYKNVHNLFLLTVVDTAFWTTMIVFQVPAGLIGDRYGRKKVLFIGELIYSIGILAFGLSDQFWTFLFSNILWALGVCFVVSGDTPFLYDTLLEVKRSHEFIGIMAKSWAVMATMNAAACIVGGVLVQYTNPHRLDLTLIIASLIGLVGSLTAVFLKEPKVDRSKVETMITQMKTGFSKVLKSRAIMVLIMFQIVIEIAVYVMAVFRSVYMNDVLKLDYLWIGIFFAAFIMFGGFIALGASRFEHRLGEKRSLLFMLLALMGSFAVVFIVKSPAAIGIQFMIYAVSSLQSPIISGYINKRVDSQHRSTVVAIASLMFTSLLVAVELPSGWFADQFGTRETMMVLAIGVAPFGFYLLRLWNREVDATSEPKRKKIRVLKEF
jgi:MFS family permease